MDKYINNYRDVICVDIYDNRKVYNTIRVTNVLITCAT